MQILSPMWVYFNAISIFREFELWRLVTNFFFFGKINIDFFFHMFFLTRYAKMLEEGPLLLSTVAICLQLQQGICSFAGTRSLYACCVVRNYECTYSYLLRNGASFATAGSFRGRSADFLWMLIFGGFVMCCIAPFVNIHFLGSSLTFMMVYVWGRRNENVHMSVLGLLHFTAPYFPWVLLGFSLLIGKDSRTVDLVGMVAGHMYFFLEDVFPQLRGKRPLKTPRLLHALFGTSDEEGDEGVVNIRANLNQQHAVHQRQQQQQQQEEQLHEHRGENERAASEAAADEQDVGQSGQERSTSASLKNNSPGEEDSGLHHPASFERHAKNNHAEANSVAHEARFRGETDAGTSGEDSASKHARSSPTDRNGLGQKEHDE